jgi:aldose 1-epimerase
MGTFMSTADLRLLTLSCGPFELQLAPPVGGSIARFDYRMDSGERIPCFPGVEGVEYGPLDCGSFPLVPYCNRIRGGRFAFRGREIVLRPNMAGDPSPLHGQGWLSPWDVVSADEAAATLVFRHEAGEWPWAYEARQDFTLDQGGLSATLSCTNRSSEPMPCGLGHHPYFACNAETRIDTDVACAWNVDEDVLPLDKVPAEGRYDLRDRLICGQGLDNGFGGWSGRARIATPDAPFRLELSSPDARFFQLYSPVSGGFFAAEPVGHANAALNAPEEDWAELGIEVLKPGATMSLTMRVDVIELR